MQTLERPETTSNTSTTTPLPLEELKGNVWDKRVAVMRERGTTLRDATLRSASFWGINNEKAWAHALADLYAQTPPSEPNPIGFFHPSYSLDSPCPSTRTGREALENFERLYDYQKRRMNHEFAASLSALVEVAPLPDEAHDFQSEDRFEGMEEAFFTFAALLACVVVAIGFLLVMGR